MSDFIMIVFGALLTISIHFHLGEIDNNLAKIKKHLDIKEDK